MSFNALVIPEDPANNGYILKPLVERMLEACGKPNARVDVLSNPRAQGYEHAKTLLRNALLDRYRHKDLLLFLVDADGRDRGDEFRAWRRRRQERRRAFSAVLRSRKSRSGFWLGTETGSVSAGKRFAPRSRSRRGSSIPFWTLTVTAVGLAEGGTS